MIGCYLFEMRGIIGFHMLGFIYLGVGLAPYCFMDRYDMFLDDDTMLYA